MRSLRLLKTTLHKPAKIENPFRRYKELPLNSLEKMPVRRRIDDLVGKLADDYKTVAEKKTGIFDNVILTGFVTAFLSVQLGAVMGLAAVLLSIKNSFVIKKTREYMRMNENALAQELGRYGQYVGPMLYLYNEERIAKEKPLSGIKTVAKSILAGSIAYGLVAAIVHISAAIERMTVGIGKQVAVLAGMFAALDPAEKDLKKYYLRSERQESMQRISDLADK